MVTSAKRSWPLAYLLIALGLAAMTWVSAISGLNHHLPTAPWRIGGFVLGATLITFPVLRSMTRRAGQFPPPRDRATMLASASAWLGLTMIMMAGVQTVFAVLSATIYGVFMYFVLRQNTALPAERPGAKLPLLDLLHGILSLPLTVLIAWQAGLSVNQTFVLGLILVGSLAPSGFLPEMRRGPNLVLRLAGVAAVCLAFPWS